MRTPLPRFAVLVLAVVMYGTGLFAQDVTVHLTERTPGDDNTVGLVALSETSGETLTLPKVDRQGASFIEIFYSNHVEGDNTASVLIFPDPAGQILYIDLNNDSDLTNDGPPLVFPFSQNELTFYLRSGDDPEQRTLRSLSRIPPHAFGDSVLTAEYVDVQGALYGAFLDFFLHRNPEADGSPHTFLFENSLELSRGSAELGEKTYMVGLYDSNQNGLFNDRTNEKSPLWADWFMIDLDGSGSLNPQVTTEVFMLDEVFEVAGTRYTLTDIDPYGRHVTLSQTDQPVTNTHAALWQDSREEWGEVSTAKMPEGFWDETFTTVDGEVLPASDLRGRYVLLNFWGEWCSPCLHEMPALSSAREQWPEDEFALVGVLKTYDMDKAMEIVDKRDLDWPHVNVTDAIVEQFAVEGYPTNILILPDGERYIKAGQVSTAFFERNME